MDCITDISYFGGSLMIHDIEPHKLRNEYRTKKPQNRDICIWFSKGEPFLSKDTEFPFPTFEELSSIQPSLSDKLYEEAEYLFQLDNQDFYFWVHDFSGEELATKYQFEKQEAFRTLKPKHYAFAGITACQIYRFRLNNRYCGRCGNEMKHSLKERANTCDACGKVTYPTISPAIIVAIENEDRLLLTRYAKGNYKRYGLVAGFVEIGESLEETVRREVMEEVGLKVKNIRYYKSQPWSFSDSMMIGFYADLDGEDKVILQEEELSEATWFKRDELPYNESSISIAQELIENFRNGTHRVSR